MSDDWEHKDIWTKRSSKFTVEVSRHEVHYKSDVRDHGPHRWCVYVYVYPTHPFFKRIQEDIAAPPDETGWKSSYPNMVGYLPLHCGCTFFHAHRDDRQGEITSFQIGADYDHLHDEYFTHLATRDEAGAVFANAEELERYMKGEELK